MDYNRHTLGSIDSPTSSFMTEDIRSGGDSTMYPNFRLMRQKYEPSPMWNKILEDLSSTSPYQSSVMGGGGADDNDPTVSVSSIPDVDTVMKSALHNGNLKQFFGDQSGGRGNRYADIDDSDSDDSDDSETFSDFSDDTVSLPMDGGDDDDDDDDDSSSSAEISEEKKKQKKPKDEDDEDDDDSDSEEDDDEEKEEEEEEVAGGGRKYNSYITGRRFVNPIASGVHGYQLSDDEVSSSWSTFDG